MFGLLKRPRWKPRDRARPRTIPGAEFKVDVTATEIVSRRPEGKVERVALADLRAVIIETNDRGPFGADLWWILIGRGPASGCVFPGGATGAMEVFDVLQKLTGFDNRKIVQAMGSTRNARFVCWQDAMDRADVGLGPDTVGARAAG